MTCLGKDELPKHLLQIKKALTQGALKDHTLWRFMQPGISGEVPQRYKCASEGFTGHLWERCAAAARDPSAGACAPALGWCCSLWLPVSGTSCSETPSPAPVRYKCLSCSVHMHEAQEVNSTILYHALCNLTSG